MGLLPVSHGHDTACTKYRLADGGKIWKQPKTDNIMFGVQVGYFPVV